MDGFSRRTRYAGFQGQGGQMFFNILVRLTGEEALGEALRTALPVPSDESDARTKLVRFTAFVEAARERAGRPRGASVGYGPFFVSFFWEAQDRDQWPIYFPASRGALGREGLFVDEGPFADRYIAFRTTIFTLRDQLETDTWGVEAFLWHLDKEATSQKTQKRERTAAPSESARVRRAWLMRGGRIGGTNFVPHFLDDGFIALGWDAPTPLKEGMSRAEIAAALTDAYPEESAGTIRNWTGIDYRFVTLVEPDDLVLTPDGANLYVGRVTGGAEQTTYADASIVRRQVEWLNRADPVQRARVQREFPSLYSKMRTLLTITDLKEDAATVARLAGLASPSVVSVPPAAVPPVGEALARRLFVPHPWLQEILDLLNEKKQLVFYGPPGTGKTFVAQALGEHIEEVGGEYDVVQFHPSYSYEDFFEGFRPRQAEGADGLSFDLTSGPLKRIAEEARANPSRPYLLVIDEINRGNIAKIFGELYFLLEYRNRAIKLQYSPDASFSLPPNLYFVGTMNTADRSIALVDSALRRRFYFIPFLPRNAPIRDVLRLWLEHRKLGDEPARLLDALNAALESAPGIGDEFAIGPSYFMVDESSGDPRLEHVWRFAIMPLLEERFYGAKRAAELEREFGLAALQRRLAHGSSKPVEPSAEAPTDGE
jgi:5-methylcytosine-specific restriction enzyme B